MKRPGSATVRENIAENARRHARVRLSIITEAAGRTCGGCSFLGVGHCRHPLNVGAMWARGVGEVGSPRVYREDAVACAHWQEG